MRRTILLADDSVTIRKIVEFTFSDTDIRVCSVASGQEAIDCLSDVLPDLVLADVVMPGLSGYDLCRVIKTSDRPVPVLLLAGTFEPFDAGLARDCRSDGHLTKPFDSRLLVARVEEFLARPEEPANRLEVPVPGPDDDLEAMFDDLATPPIGHDSSHDSLERPLDAVPLDPGRAVGQVSSEVKVTFSETPTLSSADLDAIARRVVEHLSERVIREVAWDVVPDLAEILVRERIRELERDESEPS